MNELLDQAALQQSNIADQQWIARPLKDQPAAINAETGNPPST
jgi:hypothetical protein